MVRLTFVGDIALDKPLLKAAKARGNGEFDFSGVFRTEEVFRDSDLVVGNLETVFGGGHRFNKKPYHYNSPDSFCRAIRDAGIGLVGTANNHCTDEGAAGLRRTLEVLDKYGIAHTGTYAETAEDRYIVKEIKGLRVAFYSLTFSVNVGMESLTFKDLYRYVNLIGFQGKRFSYPGRILHYSVIPKIRQLKKKLRKQPTLSVQTDKLRESLINREWMADIEKQIGRAKENSDILVVLLHIGGQFNVEPGDYSKYMTDRLCELGADVIIGNHPHTIQRVEKRDGKIVAYSLGGYCMSVSGEYLVHDCLPEYSLALHVEVDENTLQLDCAYDLIKGTEDEEGYLCEARAEESSAHIDELSKRIRL